MDKCFEYYIIVSNYSESNSRRQPWYTVKHLKEVILSGRKVTITDSFSKVPNKKGIRVIKFWGIKDLIPKKQRNYQTIFLLSFPFFKLFDVLKKPSILIENWKDMWKIFICSLIPMPLISLSIQYNSEFAICISDRINRMLPSKINRFMYYPFFKDNWGGIESTRKSSSVKTICYFGPPFSSRGFDEVFKLASKSNSDYKFKFIIRTERKELEDRLSSFKNIDSKRIEVISGFLSRSELKRELDDVDLVILPFAFVFSELPIVVLEALELNKKVLTTECSGVDDFLDGLSTLDHIDFSKVKNIELDSISYTKTEGAEQLMLEKLEVSNNKLRSVL